MAASNVRMIGDVGSNTLVNSLRQSAVVDTVLLHLVLCLFVSCHYLLPQAEPFVLHLVSDVQHRSDVFELVGEKPSLVTKELVKVYMARRRRRADASKDKLSDKMRIVKPFSVVGYKYVCFFEQIASGFQHSEIAVLPFGEEHNVFLAEPLGGETK